MDDLFGDVTPASSSSKAGTGSVEEEEYESVLFVARECYVYRLPPRTSTAGYRAGEWVRDVGDIIQQPEPVLMRQYTLSRATWRPSSGKVRCSC